MEALATYVAAASRGMKFNLPQAHPEERRMYELGKRAFYFRGGPHDFSCASCHGEDGKRIRLQDLPDLTQATPATASASPPGRPTAFPAASCGACSGASTTATASSASRIPGFGSDVTIALGSYMGVNAKGAESIAPSIKR